MCSNIEDKESNEIDTTEGQEFCAGWQGIYESNKQHFHNKKNKWEGSKCYRVLSCIKSNKFKPKWVNYPVLLGVY